MSVQNVVLGELIRRRGYGYGYELLDQLREFSDVLGYSPTFVYAALDALERQGLVTVVDRGDGDESPRRRRGRRQSKSRVYYEVTSEGHARFEGWMAGSPQKAPLREDLHMQLMAADADDLPRLIPTLRDFEEQCREALRQIMERPLGTPAASTERGRTVGAALVQDALIAHLQTSMEWAQRSRGTLQRLVSHPTGVPGRHRP